MRICHLFLALGVIALWSCTDPGSPYPTVTLQYTGDQDQQDALVTLDVSQLQSRHPELSLQGQAFFDGQTPVPFQAVDADKDGQSEKILLLTQLKAGQAKKISLRNDEAIPDFPRRAYAELSHKVGGSWEDREYLGGTFQNVRQLRVPDAHTDHSWFIRYEGPGWESDKVAYRFYLDWRNAVDIFGKRTPDMILAQVGQDGFDSYHEMAPWGMDILKVGGSLGLGSIGKWHLGKAERVAMTDSIYCEVAQDGPLQSQIRTHYFGWTTNGDTFDLVSELSIHAGSRMTRQQLKLSHAADSLCTGIVKLEGAEKILLQGPTWSCLATWGTQSLNEDQLGMAVIYPSSKALTVTEDQLNHVVLFKPGQDELTYYFLAAWEKEPRGIASREAFERYLDTCLYRLSNPPKVQY